MRKLILVSLGFAALLLGVLLLYRTANINPASDSSRNQNTAETLETQEINLPLVLVTAFTTAEKDIRDFGAGPAQVLIDQEVEQIALSSQILAVLGLPGTLATKTVDVESITRERNGVKVLELEAKSLLVTFPNKVSFANKLLTIDGKSVFKDQDYPLVFKALESSPLVEYRVDFAKVNRIFYGGELIPARAVDRLFLNQSNNYTFLFDRIKNDIKDADLAMSLLENPISGDPKPCTGCTQFVSDARNAQGFAEVGFDILGFGNHAGDGGVNAIKDTEELLNQNNIDFTGVSSKNLDDAAKLVVRNFAGKKLGFLSFDDVAYFYWAAQNRWGTNRFSIINSKRVTEIDEERVKKVISEAKEQVDYLVVMASWGVEYTDTANKHQVELAHLIIDHGADFVVATHPHWVQNFEIYQGKPIFYSLGNLIFDQTHTTPTRQSIYVNAYYYGGELKQLDIVPILNCGYHQTKNNLADKVIAGELTYEQVDATAEAQGCVYWQPKPVKVADKNFQEIWSRFTKSTKI